MRGRITIVLGAVLAAAAPAVAQDDELEIWVPADAQALVVSGDQGERNAGPDHAMIPMNKSLLRASDLLRLSKHREPADRFTRFFTDPDVKALLYRDDGRSFYFRVSGPWRDTYITVPRGRADDLDSTTTFRILGDFPSTERPVAAPHMFFGSATVKLRGTKVEGLPVYITLESASAATRRRSVEGEEIDRVLPFDAWVRAVTDESGTARFQGLAPGKWKLIRGTPEGSSTSKIGDDWLAWSAVPEDSLDVDEDAATAEWASPIEVVPMDALLTLGLKSEARGAGMPLFARLIELDAPEGRLPVAAFLPYATGRLTHTNQTTGLRPGRYAVALWIDGMDRPLSRVLEVAKGINKVEWTVPLPTSAQEIRVRFPGLLSRRLTVGSRRFAVLPCAVGFRGPWTEPSPASSQDELLKGMKWDGETLILPVVFPGEHELVLSPVMGQEAAGLDEEELSEVLNVLLRTKGLSTSLKVVEGTREYTVQVPGDAFSEKP